MRTYLFIRNLRLNFHFMNKNSFSFVECYHGCLTWKLHIINILLTAQMVLLTHAKKGWRWWFNPFLCKRLYHFLNLENQPNLIISAFDSSLSYNPKSILNKINAHYPYSPNSLLSSTNPRDSCQWIDPIRANLCPVTTVDHPSSNLIQKNLED